ncbi:MAG: hypothetical protein KDD53_00930, partial [Bdellovibrionales bacterium]|nr:hypothetical protein [Bdellovibrionales bacterium]
MYSAGALPQKVAINSGIPDFGEAAKTKKKARKRKARLSKKIALKRKNGKNVKSLISKKAAIVASLKDLKNCPTSTLNIDTILLGQNSIDSNILGESSQETDQLIITSITDPISFASEQDEYKFEIFGANFRHPYEIDLSQPFTTLLVQKEGTNIAYPYPISYIDSGHLTFSSAKVGGTFNVTFLLVNYDNGHLTFSNSYTVLVSDNQDLSGTPDPGGNPSATPTPTLFPTPTPTPTSSPTPTPTPTLPPQIEYNPTRRIDFGSLNGDPQPESGYELFSETVPLAGVTISPPPYDTVHVSEVYKKANGIPYPSNVVSIDPDRVNRRHLFTSLLLNDNSVISISGLTPNSSYRVLLELGALSPWVEYQNSVWTGLDSVSRKLRVQVKKESTWKLVASDINARSAYSSGSFATPYGGVIPVWIIAPSNSTGTVQIKLSTDGDDPVMIAGLEVHRYEALPIYYKFTGSGALHTNSLSLVSFVNAFNEGNFDLAQSLALTIEESFERGVALSYLIGWLDGSRDGRFSLISQAKSALELALTYDHPGAAYLLKQLDSLELAINHLNARGYSSWRACPDSGGKGYLNPDCAGQIYAWAPGKSYTNNNAHIALRELSALIAPISGTTVLEDISQWNLDNIDEDIWEPSPFVFAAIKEYGAAISTMNPLLSFSSSDPESTEVISRFQQIFTDFSVLGFSSTHFPKDLELKMFKAYADAGSHPREWPLEDLEIFSDSQIAESWWGDEVSLLSEDPSAPSWGNSQRQLGKISENMVRYWVENRLDNGEYGGGLGDDVELLLQFQMILGRVDKDSIQDLKAAIDLTAQYTIFNSGEVTDGYYSNDITDVEHTAEYTANTYTTTRTVFGHTASNAEIALGVASHLKSSSSPDAAFGDFTDLNHWHFKSYHFTNLGPSTDSQYALDLFLNGRSMIPATFSLNNAPLATMHPMKTDLISWASAWRDDALLPSSQANGKPEGFLAPAEFSSNAIGSGGIWYSEAANKGDDSIFPKGNASYIIEILRMAYLNSTESNRWQYLIPAARMLRAVKQWEDSAGPSAASGSKNWAAEQFRKGARFGGIVIAVYDLLANDLALNSTIDPLSGGAYTYVDGDLLDKMRSWAEDEYDTDQGPVMKYALADLGTCAGHENKNFNHLKHPLIEAITFYRNFYPLLTKRAMHTDRIFANKASATRDILVAARGGQLVEGITYQPIIGLAAPNADIAVLMNYRDYGATTWSAFVYNFSPSAETFELALDEGLKPGQYNLEIAPSSGMCDVFESTPTLVSTISKKGVGAKTSITIPVGLSLVK